MITDWQEKDEVKMGNIGEDIIFNYLKNKNFTIYQATTKKAHPCDGIAFKNKELMFLYDVKTKGKTNNHNAQGIDKKHYNIYNNLMKTFNVSFYVFFIDDQNGDVHCADLKELDNKKHINIKKDGSIIGWDVKNLNYLFTLDKTSINDIKKHNTRNYFYKHTQTRLF